MSASISKVKKEFGAWRREHGGRARRLPAELQAQAVQLLEEHTWSAVSEELSISNASLSKWRQSREVQGLVEQIVQAGGRGGKRRTRRLNSGDDSQFVEIAGPMVAMGQQKKDVGEFRVKLETPGGFGLEVEGVMDGALVQGLAQVVCQLGGR